MIDLLIDVHDDSFSASTSAIGSQPFAARMFDLSIFARNGFLDEQTNAKLTMTGSTKGGAFKGNTHVESYGRCKI